MGIPARRDLPVASPRFGWHGQVLLPVACAVLIDTGKSTCPCHPVTTGCEAHLARQSGHQLFTSSRR